MKWVVRVARVLVGLPFVVFSSNYFLKFMEQPRPEGAPEDAVKFGSILVSSGYMNAVKVLELVGGALVLSGRMTPLGLVLLTPVAVNIALYDLFLMHKPGLGTALAVLCFFLVWGYRSYFARVFTVSARPG